MTSDVMSSIEKRVGARIAEERRLAGLTQARLAERIGVITETISRIETGATATPLKRIEAIANALGLEPQELFRFGRGKRPEDVAIERLLWLVSKKTAGEIDFATGVAAAALDYLRRRSAG